ncbi:hypothetical protein GCM10007972_17100 [Iodidimonas muriae]|uniref:HTH cro/C1-type domain-containing protein n=1 Tax=Iodidimonas muriae TaxID=261467 RepID=A0ABQ2LDH9_9PROT|nr:hypothetical protein [Iodidimonas muriae]GER07814.1 hypothetical protein JCM17843_21240 [Kordiimonadales bacterium JCM 17843]GGO12303.1 hypothetical protein GCM10007972_17100 [Iodidimonas muriae]
MAQTIPHEWPEIEAQVRDAIIAMASILQRFGPHDDGTTVASFLGQPVEFAGKDMMSDEEIASVDITRHQLYDFVRAAWCYAYQVEGWQDFTSDVWHDVCCGLLSGGYAQADNEGEPTGFWDKSHSSLYRVLETAVTRWNLTHENSDLNVRELALLSNMTEATVRSSLSKEGFKLEQPKVENNEKSYILSSAEARQWLSRRRGFIPNATAPSPDKLRITIRETLADRSVPFPTALKRMAQLAQSTKAGEVEINLDWYLGLIEGRAVSPDVDALIALADAFDVPRAEFAARGVEHLLRLAETHQEESPNGQEVTTSLPE